MLIIYHANCGDGFTAAWVAFQRFPDARFVGAHYGQEPPKIQPGEDVMMVDFSYKRDVLIEMAKVASTVTVIDHHETAQKELVDLPDNVIVKFDMAHSGAYLTWMYLGDPLKEPHWLIRYTQDRDLWQWKLPQSREVNSALMSYPMDFQTWTGLSLLRWQELSREGGAILRYQEKVTDSHVRNARKGKMLGHEVYIVNATSLYSEIAGELCKKGPFGVCYFRRLDGKYQFSLRGRDETGIKVNDIAKRFGGGGHPMAAGFELSEELMALALKNGDLVL